MSDSASKLTVRNVSETEADAFAPTQPEPESDTSEPPPPPIRVDSYLGATFDNRYVIEAPLREGGMGLIYRATHRKIGKAVAIKILREDMVADSEMLKRFRNEARAVSLVESPHIIDITDYGVLPDGARYYVMELLEGETLGDLIARTGPLHLSTLVRIAKQIAMGVGAAHAANIIHRDLKPDNVMLIEFGQEKNFVKVLDFGIAKVSTDSHKLTKTGAVFGTPLYMSPEQAAGLETDQRSDIYSLGVIMFEMATGRPPFNAENVMAILSQHMYKAPPSLRSLVPDIPEALEAIIVRLLSKKPETRYATMNELLADLEQVENGLAPESTARVLAQSAELSAPADYFGGERDVPRTTSPVTTISLRPAKRPKWHIAVAAIVAGSAVVASVAFLNRRVVEPEKPVPAKTALTVEPDPPPPSMTPPATKAENPSSDVKLVVEPANARVSTNGKILSARTFTITKGESLPLTVEAPGYASKAVALSTQDAPEVTVALSPLPKAGPVINAAPKASTQMGGSGPRKCGDGEVPAYDHCVK